MANENRRRECRQSEVILDGKFADAKIVIVIARDDVGTTNGFYALRRIDSPQG